MTSGDPIVDAVREDLLQRSLIGQKKYGATLAESPETHRARLEHAYQEALDLANYLKWAIIQLDETTPRS